MSALEEDMASSKDVLMDFHKGEIPSMSYQEYLSGRRGTTQKVGMDMKKRDGRECSL